MLFHNRSYFAQAPPDHDDFCDEMWGEFASAYEQQTGVSIRQQRQDEGPIKIACLRLNLYKPEEVTVDVDDEKITLHGQHRTEAPDGFESREFKKLVKLPDIVDPRTVMVRTLHGGKVLLLLANRRVEERADRKGGKFVVKVDLSGFKPEEIKVQLRGNEMTITGEHTSDADESGFPLSRDYSRRILLPRDVDLDTVTSRLSKEGLLTIEASVNPALLPRERNLEIAKEVDQPPKEKPKSGKAGKEK